LQGIIHSYPLDCVFLRIGCKEDDFDERVLVVSCEGQQLLILIDAGSKIWRMCDGSRNLELILKSLTEDFTEAPINFRYLVDGFLKDLVERGLMISA